MRLPGRRGQQHRTAGPPPEVVAATDLAKGERVLAAARGEDRTWLLGTRTRLAVVAPDGSATSLAWEEVEDAGWDAESSRIEVREAGEFGRPRRTWSVAMGDADPRALLQLLRERVTASIVVQRKAQVRGRRGVVVACRRSPVGGPLRWTVDFDPGVDPDDPEALAVAEELLAKLRRELGELADS